MGVSIRHDETARGAVDAFLALYAAKTMCRRTRQPGKTLFHKVIFAARGRLGERSAPKYPFIRYHYGPYSPELARDLGELAGGGMLRPGALGITDRGRHIVEAYGPELERLNEHLFRVMREEAERRACWSAEQAKKEAYGIRVLMPGRSVGVPVEVSLREVPEGLALRFPDVAVPELRAPPDLLAELAFDLSMDADGVRRANMVTAASTAGVRELLGL